MPYKVPSVADLERNLPITIVFGVPEITPDNPIKVSFRQARNREDTLLQNWIQQEPAVYEYGEGSSVRQEVKSRPDMERRAYEIYLTMTACDIVSEDDTPLFKFSELNDTRKVAGSFDKFLDKCGDLPTSITRALHLKCIEATPEWAFYWASRQAPAGDDDEGEQ